MCLCELRYYNITAIQPLIKALNIKSKSYVSSVYVCVPACVCVSVPVFFYSVYLGFYFRDLLHFILFIFFIFSSVFYFRLLYFSFAISVFFYCASHFYMYIRIDTLVHALYSLSVSFDRNFKSQRVGAIGPLYKLI